MNSIEEYVKQNRFSDLTTAEISYNLSNEKNIVINPIALGRLLAKLIPKKLISRRIKNGTYLYTSLSPAPEPSPTPSLTVQAETPVVSNTVQFSDPYVTPYEPDQKYADLEDKLDSAYQTIEDYKSLVCKMLNFMKRTANADTETLILLADIRSKF